MRKQKALHRMMNQTAEQFLANAESFDGYQMACRVSPVNSAARRSCLYKAWSDQSLAHRFAGYSRAPIVIVHPSAEGGMPHTRGNGIVCIPAHFPEHRMVGTLQHEAMHISQRDFPDYWQDKLKIEGWEPVHPKSAEMEIPTEWYNLCRYNPDTFHSRWWAWRGYSIPLPLFTRADKPDLHDIVVRWYDRSSGRVLSSPPTSFTQRYGNINPSAMEHPFELYAYQKH